MLGLLRSAVAFFAGEPELTERFVRSRRSTAMTRGPAASVRMFRAHMSENDGDIVAMREDMMVAVAEFQELGDRWGLASTLRGIAQLHTLEGRLDEAAAAYEESLRLSAELSSREDEGFLLEPPGRHRVAAGRRRAGPAVRDPGSGLGRGARRTDRGRVHPGHARRRRASRRQLGRGQGAAPRGDAPHRRRCPASIPRRATSGRSCSRSGRAPPSRTPTSNSPAGRPARRSRPRPAPVTSRSSRRSG